MTVTVWIKREIVLDWAHYKNNPGSIFEIHTREPGNIDFMQVQISHEMYINIITSLPLNNKHG